MKLSQLSLGMLALGFLVLGSTVASARMISTVSNPLLCGPLRTFCMRDTRPQCTAGTWQCVPVRASSSSRSSIAACGPNNVRCLQNTTPVCSGGSWTCAPLRRSSSSSSVKSVLPSSCTAICPDGSRYRTCSEDGHPIYYFADPCLTHPSTSVSSQSSSANPYACGPNAVLCAQGTNPSCMNGKWQCVPQLGGVGR